MAGGFKSLGPKKENVKMETNQRIAPNYQWLELAVFSGFMKLVLNASIE